MLRRALDESFDPEVRDRVALLTMARTAANGAFRFAPPFLAVIARGNGVSIAGLGVALAIGEASGLVSPLSGELVDRLDRRIGMSIGLAGNALGAVLAATSHGPVQFAIALVLIAQAKVIFDLGLGAWVSDRVPYDRRSRVMGVTETSWALGLLVGVSGMGLITAATSYRVAYLVAAAAVATMAVLVFRNVAPDYHHHARRTAPRGRLDRRRALMVAVGGFSLMAASQTLFVTFGSWLVDAFTFSAVALSVVTFGLGFCELFSSTSSARKADAWGKEWSTALGAAIMIPCAVGIVLWHAHLWVGLPLVIVAIAAFEFAIVSLIPLSTTLVKESPARGMAVLLSCGTLGRASMSLAATRLYVHHGIAAPAVLCAVFASITVATMVTMHRELTSDEEGATLST